MVAETSKRVYEFIGQIKNEDQQQVMYALSNLGSATDSEIAEHLGEPVPVDSKKYRPRRNELVEEGFVIEVATRRCKVSNNSAKVWAIAEEKMPQRIAHKVLSNSEMANINRKLQRANKFQLNKIIELANWYMGK